MHPSLDARLLALVSNSLRDAFWFADATHGALTYISPAYERIWGRTVASILDAPETWEDAIHPDDRERIVSARSHRDMASAWEDEYRIVRPDGGTRWIRERCVPSLADDGHLAGVAEDITEVRELEVRLEQTPEREPVGPLASVIAHDFNNLLTIIVACTEELLERIPKGDEMYVPLVETREAVRRATCLTRDLLDLSRRQAGQPQHVVPTRDDPSRRLPPSAP